MFTSIQNTNCNSTTSLRGNSDSSIAGTAHSVAPLTCSFVVSSRRELFPLALLLFIVHQAVSLQEQGFESKRQSCFERVTLPHRYALSRDLYLLGTYHCIFYFCCPQPVSTYVNDIIHAPCYLVIAFLAPVSTIPCEVVTCSKDTRLISSSKWASFGLWCRTDHAIGWRVGQGGLGSSQAFASSQLCDLPNTISHFPLPSLALCCSTWAVLAPNKHLNSTKTVKLTSLPRWTNHCRQSAATSG